MALVVWAIKIHAVPARREGHLGADAAFTHPRGKVRRVLLGAWSTAEGIGVLVDAAVADTAGFTSGIAQH